MATTYEAVELYQRIAEEYHRLDAPEKRDRFLVLAADAAFAAGNRQEAERLRRAILNRNPNHLLKPYATFEEALRSADIEAYLQQLRRRYPAEAAMTLLEQLRRTGQATPAASFLPKPSRNGSDDIALPLVVPEKSAGVSRPVKEHAMNDAQSGRPSPNPQVWPTAPSRESGTGGGPGVFGLKPEVPPTRPLPTAPPPLPMTAAPPPTEEPVAGGWVGGMLCVVAVLAALALLVYVFAAPFVPWW
ncbi:MAG: hypothetical protein NZM31_03810 [Gemmatales bacterium]|nr:hypothetical protein [Gemmatales bacterium]MDW8386126.1 hypothetical protein [Gemmatales bacterium]